MTRDAKKQSVNATDTNHKHVWAVINRGVDRPEISCECGAFPKSGQLPRIEAVLRLRQWLKPGDTVHTQLKSVSRSGMQRVIQVIKIECDAKREVPNLLYLGYNVAAALEMKYDREREGVKIGGCGMDMGFAIVYDLGRVLFHDGFDCIGEGCPANDHFNGDRDYTPHRHSDPGYALKHCWI